MSSPAPQFIPTSCAVSSLGCTCSTCILFSLAGGGVTAYTCSISSGIILATLIGIANGLVLAVLVVTSSRRPLAFSFLPGGGRRWQRDTSGRRRVGVEEGEGVEEEHEEKTHQEETWTRHSKTQASSAPAHPSAYCLGHRRCKQVVTWVVLNGGVLGNVLCALVVCEGECEMVPQKGGSGAEEQGWVGKEKSWKAGDGGGGTGRKVGDSRQARVMGDEEMVESGRVEGMGRESRARAARDKHGIGGWDTGVDVHEAWRTAGGQERMEGRWRQGMHTRGKGNNDMVCRKEDGGGALIEDANVESAGTAVHCMVAMLAWICTAMLRDAFQLV
ncbi:hypothetical protein B0H10DRAFT_2250872 [Mycena sp. CBHHK59/15]|nr:hypothetical protein B0H10DRAFT_2250872 [Mycena sp. CBHHK59/15]